MSGWQNSNRRDRLPPDWQTKRRQVGKRDGWRCQWQVDERHLCGSVATDVDHIVPGDDHRLENLRCLCKLHHGIKSGREGGQASQKKKRQIKARFTREERHPGLL